MQRTTALTLALLVSVSLSLMACSGDKDKKNPQIIRSSGGSSESRPGGGGPVVLVRSSAGGGGISIAPVPGAPSVASAAGISSRGLTVRDTESATLPADDAFIVVLSQFVPPGVGGFGGNSSRNQADIAKALDALGIKKEDIRFDSGGSYGPFSSISVHIPLASLTDQGKKIIDAVENVQGRSQQSGVSFGLTNCKAGVEPIRKKAFDAAAEDAKAFASMASVTLGSLTSITETISPTTNGAPTPPDPCNPVAPGINPGVANLQPLDAKPEVTARIQVKLTYSIGNDTGSSGLTVSGSGSATAKADEAYILASALTVGGPGGPQPISTKARADLMAKLKSLKIDEKDIQIGNQGYGGPTIISVETGIKDLPVLGKSVVSAVEDALNVRVDSQGVRFSHSNCDAVLMEARKQALTDAKRSADSLATVAGVKLGALSAIAEPNPSSQVYQPVQTTTGCDDDFTQAVFKGSYASGLKPFDAEPEFTVNTALNVTYAINP